MDVFDKRRRQRPGHNHRSVNMPRSSGLTCQLAAAVYNTKPCPEILATTGSNRPTPPLPWRTV